METIEKSTLYLVATPIGNLADITYRAIHILQQVDVIAAEDTRKSSILLSHYQIHTPLRSYHSYNLRHETPKLVQLLKQGQAVALISDAGTPGISDPGYHLVQACIQEGIRIIPIPGPSAIISALVASGLPSHRFVFEGFLPQKKGRKTRLDLLTHEERTVILYESPHRILKTAKELHERMGNRWCVMAREITKKFEEFFRGSLGDLVNYLESKQIKGEIVLLIQGFNKKDARNEIS